MSDCWESQEKNFKHHTISIGAHMKKVEEKNHKNISAITLFFLFNWTANCQRQFQLTAGWLRCKKCYRLRCVCCCCLFRSKFVDFTCSSKTEKEKKGASWRRFRSFVLINYIIRLHEETSSISHFLPVGRYSLERGKTVPTWEAAAKGNWVRICEHDLKLCTAILIFKTSHY